MFGCKYVSRSNTIKQGFMWWSFCMGAETWGMTENFTRPRYHIWVYKKQWTMQRFVPFHVLHTILERCHRQILFPHIWLACSDWDRVQSTPTCLPVTTIGLCFSFQQHQARIHSMQLPHWGWSIGQDVEIEIEIGRLLMFRSKEMDAYFKCKLLLWPICLQLVGEIDCGVDGQAEAHGLIGGCKSTHQDISR